MEDFEYSVEICDRDWECFFRECEECSLLPPSIAGLDDSGMSDIDDTRAIFAMRAQKVDLKAGLSEADRLINVPPDRGGSPVEHRSSKHCGGGMESVLSGSEEDLHLQCVNMFFEGLKNGTEAERLTEPSKGRDLQTIEKKQEEEKCNDEQHASSSILPKTSPKFHSLHANVETATGKETTEPVRAISSNIMKIVNGKSAPDVSLEPEVSDSVFLTNKSCDFFIREKAATVKRIDDEKKWNQSRASQDRDDCPETTICSDKVVKPDFCMTQNDIKQEHLLPKPLIIRSKNSTDLWSNLEVLADVKWKDDQNPNVLQSDKTAIQELSPSASIKRKRRKKRRLSVETAESVHGCERQTSVKQSDSEEERCLWRGGTWLCASENFNFPYLNQPQKPIAPLLSSSIASNNLPLKMSPKDVNVKGFSQHLHSCACRCQNIQEGIAGSAEDNANNDRSVVLLSQTNTGLISGQNTSVNVATGPSPCNDLGLEESAGLNANPGLPLSISDLVTGKSLHAVSFCQADEINHTMFFSETEPNPGLCTQEVMSVANSVLPSAESYDPKVDVCQNNKLSAAKSVLAVEAGKSGRNKNTLCHRETEPQQQLDFDRQYMGQYSSTMEKTQFPQPEISRSRSDAQDTLPKPTKIRACQTVEDISNQVNCDKFISESSNLLPDEFCSSQCSASQDKKAAGKQSESPSVLSALSQFKFVVEKETNTEIKLGAPPVMAFNSDEFVSSVENNQLEKKQGETKSFMPEALPTSLSNITSVSSCCTVDTESVMSLSNEIITCTSKSSSLPVSHHNSVTDKTLHPLVKNDAGDSKCASKTQSVDTRWSKCDSVVEAEDAVPAQDTKHPVFAMSSFWNEMEKLTINDILGLRRINQANPSSSLPPLQEIEETGMLAMTDSGFFNQVEESKPEKSSEDTYKDLSNGGLTSGPALVISPSDSKTVLWEDEHVMMCPAADVYSRNMLTSVNDIHESVPPKSTQTCLRKISKNISVHNLPALESAPLSYTWKNQTLPKSKRGLLEKDENVSNGNMPIQDKDCLVPSSSDTFKISLPNIIQYLFSGKQPIPSQSDTDIITSRYTDGNSVSENYHHFFSDFDTESFFYPLLTTEEQVKGELVPIFSCSRSSNRNLQYPESYEHFFASSSSDDSSDDEDNSGPVRVVTRFNRTSSASRICTDVYDHFYTDKDIGQNFFWRNSLSFRNLCLSGSAVQKQTPSNDLASTPLTQGARSIQRTAHTMNAMGNQDVMIPDPLLFHLEDRIYRQMFQQPVIYEDLQMAVSNPSLDASLLPLKQSDMCLLCIAFASWVLKTTNPQVGDAWKAVLLANVSALSAIRYLRKYIRREVTSNERRLLCNTPPSS